MLQVDTFFAVGSPLGLFLALRNIRLGAGQAGLPPPEPLGHPGSLDVTDVDAAGVAHWGVAGVQEELPACSSLINIFHPHDPVAYRCPPTPRPFRPRPPLHCHPFPCPWHWALH